MSGSVFAWVATHPSAALNAVALCMLLAAIWLIVATQLRQRRAPQALLLCDARLRANQGFYWVAKLALLASFGLSSYSVYY